MTAGQLAPVWFLGASFDRRSVAVGPHTLVQVSQYAGSPPTRTTWHLLVG